MLKNKIIETAKTMKNEKGLIETTDLSKLICENAHRNIFRDNDTPYEGHPKRMVAKFIDLTSPNGRWIDYSVVIECGLPNGIIELSYLHDVVEDGKLTHDDVKDIFQELGYGAFFLECIDVPLRLITHDKNESYDAYIEKVKSNSAASFVKMLDLMDNSDLFGLKTLGDHEIKRTKQYIDYFKALNDEYDFLDKLLTCRAIMYYAWLEK